MSLLGWYHLVTFGVIIPILAIRAKTRLSRRPLPTRRRHFQSTLTTLLILGAFSILVARREWIEIFPPALPHASGVIAGSVMLGVTIALMRPRWRRAVERRARIVQLFMPRGRAERLLWIGLAAVAGVSEEITWRGVQPVLLTIVLGRPLLAAGIVAASFGIAHVVQGWRSAAIIALLAAGFQGVVWLSGSLYVAMAVHFVYDVVAGLTYGKLGDELGYPVEGITQPDAPAPA